MSKADDTEAQANHLLTFLHLCEEQEKHGLKVKLSSMDGAVPTLEHVRSGRAHEILVPINDGKPAVWPVDIRTVQPSQNFADPTERWPEGTLQFTRLRTIRSAEARKYGATVFSPTMAEESQAMAMPDGNAMTGRGPVALLGGRWVNAAPKTVGYNGASEAEAQAQRDRSIPVFLGMALACRYEWSVWIGHNDGPRLRFLSDPLGAREVFRLRDLPPGRERRAALRNWVEGHWRRHNAPTAEDDAEARSWIKRHLRGTSDFVWNGLRCRIQPPDYEMDKIAAEAARGQAT